LSLEAWNIIGNEFKDGNSGNKIERFNPATGELVGSYVASTVEDVNDAIIAARNTFEKSSWSIDPRQRTKALKEIHELISNDIELLARIQTLENGKILRDSIREVSSAADIIDYYSGLVRNITGRTYMPDQNMMSIVVREPVGVVGILAPWNAPIVLLARSLAPALAAGNTLVIKPASHTAIATYEFLKNILENTTHLPKGVINLVIGSGEVVGAEIVKHRDIDFISFTGSTDSGALVMQEASVNIKRLSLELGGKTPNIILEDANIESAVQGAIRGSMLGSAGQICFAGTRILVHNDIYKEVSNKIVEIVANLKLGNGLDEDVDIGPIVSEAQLSNVINYIDEGKNIAELLIGGKRLNKNEYSKGFFVEPTIFGDVPPDSKIAQEEIFGPVISLIRCKHTKEMINIANNTKYGLSAAIWTESIGEALKVARKIKAGVVWINTYGNMYSETEAGSYKQSGMGGTLRGIEALNTFSELKNILIKTE